MYKFDQEHCATYTLLIKDYNAFCSLTQKLVAICRYNGPVRKYFILLKNLSIDWSAINRGFFNLLLES